MDLRIYTPKEGFFGWLLMRSIIADRYADRNNPIQRER